MRTIIILSLLLINCHTSVAADNWQPANFEYKEDKRQLDSLIQFPEAKGKVSLTLNCFSQIQTNGKMKETGCYSNNQYEQTFAAAVSKAAKKARVNPAVINGKPRKVFLQFRVEFTAEGKKEDRTETIGFYLNPGNEENVQAYGDDHIAGQRVISSNEAWNKACPHHSRFVVWVRSYLSEDGRAESPTIEHASGIVPTADCQDAIKRTIVGSQFTPAISDGVPVPSTFVEIFGN